MMENAVLIIIPDWFFWFMVVMAGINLADLVLNIWKAYLDMKLKKMRSDLAE